MYLKKQPLVGGRNVSAVIGENDDEVESQNLRLGRRLRRVAKLCCCRHQLRPLMSDLSCGRRRVVLVALATVWLLCAVQPRERQDGSPNNRPNGNKVSTRKDERKQRDYPGLGSMQLDWHEKHILRAVEALACTERHANSSTRFQRREALLLVHWPGKSTDDIDKGRRWNALDIIRLSIALDTSVGDWRKVFGVFVVNTPLQASSEWESQRKSPTSPPI